jgi:hypothetical protein
LSLRMTLVMPVVLQVAKSSLHSTVQVTSVAYSERLEVSSVVRWVTRSPHAEKSLYRSIITSIGV